MQMLRVAVAVPLQHCNRYNAVLPQNHIRMASRI